jgi:hypothetical protein
MAKRKRTDNTMAKREGQKRQWLREKGQTTQWSIFLGGAVICICEWRASTNHLIIS